MAPPSTPAPSRFLHSRRTGPGPSQGGGRNVEGGPTPTQSRQFIATPRFAVPSATQPQSQFASPVVVSSGRRPFVSSSARVGKVAADEIDIVDSSQLIGEEEDDEEDGYDDRPSRPRKGRVEKEDSIDVNSSPRSSEGSVDSQRGIKREDGEGCDAGPPPTKRRRITVSPESLEHVSSSSQEITKLKHGDDEDEEMLCISGSEPDEAPLSQAASPFTHHKDRDVEHDEVDPNADSNDEFERMLESAGSADEMGFEAKFERGQQRDAASSRHPKFQAAPRFVTVEPDEPRQFHLPDAFSPHRRGARHVMGGLAAEVRDWLFQVKGDGNETHDNYSSHQHPFTTTASRYVADDISAGPGMQILKGRLVQSANGGLGGDNEQDAGQTKNYVKLILAGCGRLSGLAGRNHVSRGTTVVIHPPTWEVSLQDQGIWTMVCDWSIADDITLASPQA